MIAAVAALRTRAAEQRQASGVSFEYEDTLVIYDLYGPVGQLDNFAAAVKRMANAIGDWRNVVYITLSQMEELAQAVHSSPPEAIFTQVYEVVGASQADEIYLCRNWQFGNRLLINSYREAKKICYGDAIGIYFSEAYFLPEAVKQRQETLTLSEKLRKLRRSLKERISGPKPKTDLAEIDFDLGYFLLPDILGEMPPMAIRLVNKELTCGIFRELADALDPDDIRSRYHHVARASTVFMMTSNFSEAQRMSVDDELFAYREFLRGQSFPRESTLVIKPHPRDRAEKIAKLGRDLGELFSDVVLLNDPGLFFVPFEIFLLQIFDGEKEATIPQLKIVTFSTACLSLGVVFHLDPLIGFGSGLVNKFFFSDYVTGRIQHEDDLRVAIQQIMATNHTHS